MKKTKVVQLIVSLLLCCMTFTSRPWAETHYRTIYMQERFDTQGTLPAGWTVRRLSGTAATWTIVGTGGNPFVQPFTRPGQAQFNSFEAQAGEQARLVSRRINLSAARDPFLSFAMYHDADLPGYRDSLYVEISTTDSVTGPWVTLGRFLRVRTLEGWTREYSPLTAYIGFSRCYIGFRGVSSWGNNIYIDQIQVADEVFHDLSAVTIAESFTALVESSSPPEFGMARGSPSLPATKQQTSSRIPTMAANLVQPLNLNFVLQNSGTFIESTYQVRWKINGQTQTAVNNTRQIGRNGRDTLILRWAAPSPGTHRITASVFMASDSNRTNDTLQYVLQVLDSTTVFYESFNGGTFPPAGWLTVNRDLGSLPPWFRGGDTSAFVPFEGTGFAADNFQRANGRYLDDYLLTPPVSGVNQGGNRDSLVFWARSVNYLPPATTYPDSLMILLSTAGADTSNFTTFVEYFEVPKSGWTRKGYALTGRVPQNSTVRVAFRYLHYNGGFGGTSSDFIGVDAVQFKRQPGGSADDAAHLPSLDQLEQNFPNPFNPTTDFRFRIADYGKVMLQVFDVLGREAAIIVNEEKIPGSYVARWNAASLPSGVYFYRLTAGAFTQTRRLVVLK